MLETHLHSPVTRDRLRSGPAADHVNAFSDWLHSQGYKAISIKHSMTALAGRTDWMLTGGLTAQDLLPGYEACKSFINSEQHVGCRGGPSRKSITASDIFLKFLQQRGAISKPVGPPPESDQWPILSEFRSWMRTHRGLAETTLDLYEGILVGLLDSLGDDAAGYSTESLRRFVLRRARPHGIERARSIVVAVRSFIRFLGLTERCSPGMEHAIPGFASWQLSSVPQFLAAEDVERVIDSCNGYTFELRDRAMLLLLARLAPRASEVAQRNVGAVLRHRSPSTTAHYAKVDFGLLSEIAQLWPEVTSC